MLCCQMLKYNIYLCSMAVVLLCRFKSILIADYVQEILVEKWTSKCFSWNFIICKIANLCEIAPTLWDCLPEMTASFPTAVLFYHQSQEILWMYTSSPGGFLKLRSIKLVKLGNKIKEQDFDAATCIIFI